MSEVIIDGCNVAECEFFEIWEKQFGRKYGCMVKIKGHTNCEDCHNCYFKQLQRAKAEKQDLINYYELREGGMLDDIKHWKNKAQELYKKLEQYKKSKQASYEAMQTEWNKAVNEYRDLKKENEKLKERLKNYVN